MSSSSSSSSSVLRFYKCPGLSPHVLADKSREVGKVSPLEVNDLSSESCFYVETVGGLNKGEIDQIKWLLAPVLEPQALTESSVLSVKNGTQLLVEIGPR